MSSLLEPDASSIISTSVESVSTSQTHSIKWRSATWKFYCRPTKEENQAYLYYTYCPDLIITPPYSTSVVENIKKYLKGYYQIIIETPLSKNQLVVN
jgi:hypothetical protein